MKRDRSPIKSPIRESYLNSGFLYIPISLHPEKHLQEGLPIAMVNDDNCIKYCKQWSRSGDRYFIYGMKDIYSSFGGRDVVNRHLTFSWDGNILHLSLGDMLIPREITDDRTEMGKGSVLVKIIDRKTVHKVWEEWELPPVMPSMSNTSPAKKRCGWVLHSNVVGLMLLRDTPPHVTNSSLNAALRSI